MEQREQRAARETADRDQAAKNREAREKAVRIFLLAREKEAQAALRREQRHGSIPGSMLRARQHAELQKALREQWGQAREWAAREHEARAKIGREKAAAREPSL